MKNLKVGDYIKFTSAIFREVLSGVIVYLPENDKTKGVCRVYEHTWGFYKQDVIFVYSDFLENRI